MDKCRLQVKAAIIYLSLMFPESARHRLLSLLLPEEKVKELLDFEESNVEYLRANARGTIEYFTESLSEQPNGDQMSDSVVFTFLDTLFNNKSEVDLVVRSRILASTKTLCAAYRMAYGNNELGLTLQQAYDVLSLVAGTQPIDFTSGDYILYGSYIRIDCLADKDLFKEHIDDLLLVQDEQSQIEEKRQCRKFPKFKDMPDGNEAQFLRELHKRLSEDKELCLLKNEDCSADNFLTLFEGVEGYEELAPSPFKASSALCFWASFLSRIYTGRKGFVLLDGTKLWRCAKKNAVGLSISEFAMNIIQDHTGSFVNDPSTFDRGSGGNNHLVDEDWWEKCEKVLTDAKEAVMPKGKDRIKNLLKKGKKL